MSTLPGPSRIPTFGTRIPQFREIVPKSKPVFVSSSIKPTDVGKSVLATGKVGTLKFVGEVHFATGNWCGIELSTDVGKNDGVIDGIQYFNFKRGRGLMTLSSNVTLLGENNSKLPLSKSTESVSSPIAKTELNPKKEPAKEQECAQLKRNISDIPNGNKILHNQTPEVKFSVQLYGSTPMNNDFLLAELKHPEKLALIFDSEEENKRDSLDLEDSLGILSASQMNDGFSLAEPFDALDDMSEPLLPSPKLTEMLRENVTLISDTTINLELSLDTVDKSKNFFERIEETPSPEELPLDPIPIIEEEIKSETTKSKTSSFITSITSITSLDTGYQGDGEMSRPGSRGADNSPLTRRPVRPQAKRTDAMTDSDFFTESDADNHDENVLKGDRKAQVIDGTLYGVDPQTAADIYANNRENMDSSGIFTDIESSNTRTEELIMNEKIDISPTDTSSKTFSENSQIVSKINSNIEVEFVKDTANIPKTTSTNDLNKKYKNTKREVQSKVKTLLENSPKVEKKILKKPGKWDAVMNKISKNDNKTKNFQEVKSRVFNGINNEPPKISPKPTNSKIRRPRTRCLPIQNSKSSNGGSINSSLSDLSATPPKRTLGAVKKKDVTQVLTPAKFSPKLNQQSQNGEGKKRTPTSLDSKTTPRKNIFVQKEKKPTSSKENVRSTVKGGRTSPVIRTASTLNKPIKPVPPRTAEALAVLVQHLVFNVEAFEVPNLRKQLKRYQFDAEQVRNAYQKLEEDYREEKRRNEVSYEEERLKYQEVFDELNENHRNQIEKIKKENLENEEKLRNENENARSELRKLYEEKLNTLKHEFDKLQKTHDESLDILREENEAIREDIDVKNEEIRVVYDENQRLKDEFETKEASLKEQIQKQIRENVKLKQELAVCKEDISKLEEERTRILEENKLSYGGKKTVGVQEVESLRVVLELKQNEVAELRKSLAELTQRAEILASCEEKAASMQARCEDLQLQLERKNDYEMMLISENKKLVKTIQEEASQRRSLALRNEELQWKLKQNHEVMAKILEQTSDDVFNRSINNEKYNSNSSLYYSIMASPSPKIDRKNKKNFESDDSPPPSPKVKGVVEKSDSVSYVLDLDESPDVVASRLVRRSFRNSQKSTPTKSPVCNNKRQRVKSNPLSQSSSASSLVSNNKIEYNRSRSVSIRNDDDYQDDFSDTSSSPSPYHYPNLKLDESPENLRKNERDLDYLDDHVLDLTLPDLPSEIGKMGQVLPRPKHMAGEAMVSESNSEDESTSSSSGHL